MNLEMISGNLSRQLAGELFPNTSNGRTLSRMTADLFGTDTETVHTVGLGVIVGVILIISRK